MAGCIYQALLVHASHWQSDVSSLYSVIQGYLQMCPDDCKVPLQLPLHICHRADTDTVYSLYMPHAQQSSKFSK